MPRIKPQDTHHTFLGARGGALDFSPSSEVLSSIPFCDFGKTGNPIEGVYLMVGPHGRSGWQLNPQDVVTLHAEGGVSITSECGKYWAFENDWKDDD